MENQANKLQCEPNISTGKAHPYNFLPNQRQENTRNTCTNCSISRQGDLPSVCLYAAASRAWAVEEEFQQNAYELLMVLFTIFFGFKHSVSLQAGLDKWMQG